MELKLQISKLNGIDIIQLNTSDFSIENKKDEKTGITFGKSITNQTTDLGAGKKTFSTSFIARKQEDNGKLFNAVFEIRKVEFTDQFNGRMNLFIDNAKITDSIEKVGIKVFTIQATVQEFKENFTQDTVEKLKKISATLEASIANKANIVKEKTQSINTVTNGVSGKIEFVDKMLNNVSSGVQSVIDAQHKVLGVFNEVKSRTDKVKRLIRSIENLASFPEDFLNLIKQFVTEELPEDLNLNFEIKKVSGVDAIETNREIITNRDGNLVFEEASREQAGNELANTIKTQAELNSLTQDNFTTQAQFNKRVENVLKKLEMIDELTQAELIDLKNHAIQHRYKTLFLKRYVNEISLFSALYKEYGNIDDFSEIRKINGLKDSELIKEVLLYET